MRVPGPIFECLYGPRLGPAGFYSLSPLIPTASVMKWGVSFLVSQGGNRDYGSVAALRRGGGGSWTLWVCFQIPACWGSPSRPFQPGFLSCAPVTRVSPTLLGCTGLCPLPPGLGSQLRFLSGCHPGDKVWLQERAGVGWVAWGSGFLRQPRVGAWGASSHEIPSQGMWSGGPALREPGTRALGNTQQTGCSAPSWPPTLPPLRGSQAAYGGHTLLCLRSTMSGSLKQSCC